jgi:hypothetical protein
MMLSQSIVAIDAVFGPLLTQLLDQQLEDRRGVLCGVVAAGAQVRAQQLLSAKHVQRQIAVAVVAAVEEALLLLAVQRVVGGIEVQHELRRRGLEAGDELLDQQLVQPHRGGAIGPALQPAQRGRTGHPALDGDGGLHGRVAAQCAVVVQVLPAQRQPDHALAQHVAHGVRDPQRVARVSCAAAGRFDQPELAIDGRQQHHPAVAGHAAAVEAAFDNPSAHATEIDHTHVRWFGTGWFRHRPLACLDSTPRSTGIQRVVPFSSSRGQAEISGPMVTCACAIVLFDRCAEPVDLDDAQFDDKVHHHCDR